MTDGWSRCSLSDFQRNTTHYLRELESTGRPIALTVNGRRELVIQSAQAYRELLDDRELLNSLRRIRRGLEQARLGECRPARAFVEDLAKKHRISLRP